MMKPSDHSNGNTAKLALKDLLQDVLRGLIRVLILGVLGLFSLILFRSSGETVAFSITLVIMLISAVIITFNQKQSISVGLHSAMPVEPFIEGRDKEPSGKRSFSAAEEAEAKKQVYLLADAFIRSHLEREYGTFQAIWDKLQHTTIANLENLFLQQAASSAGLGFSGTSELRSVISVISWAVEHQSELASMPSTRLVRRIAAEAGKRGSNPALSDSLANYLQSRLQK